MRAGPVSQLRICMGATMFLGHSSIRRTSTEAQRKREGAANPVRGFSSRLFLFSSLSHRCILSVFACMASYALPSDRPLVRPRTHRSPAPTDPPAFSSARRFARRDKSDLGPGRPCRWLKRIYSMRPHDCEAVPALETGKLTPVLLSDQDDRLAAVTTGLRWSR